MKIRNSFSYHRRQNQRDWQISKMQGGNIRKKRVENIWGKLMKRGMGSGWSLRSGSQSCSFPNSVSGTSKPDDGLSRTSFRGGESILKMQKASGISKPWNPRMYQRTHLECASSTTSNARSTTSWINICAQRAQIPASYRIPFLR